MILAPHARPSLRRADRPGTAPALRTIGTWLLAVAALTGFAPAWAQVASPDGTRTGTAVELESRVFDIARQLRCPTCVSESVADSNANISIEMRRQIQSQLEAGASEAEILAFFQERYGDWILLEPPRRGIHLFVWWLPGIALAAGAGGLAWLMVRWTRAGGRAAAEGTVEDEDLARVRAALDDDEAAS